MRVCVCVCVCRQGRSIHAYHCEGAGGGHAPDIIAVCGRPEARPLRPLSLSLSLPTARLLFLRPHRGQLAPPRLAAAGE